MTSRIKTYLFFLAFLAPSFCVWASEPIQFDMTSETIEIPTDGRAWTEGSRNDVGNKGFIEYVLNGEDIKNWSELVTVNYFQGLEGPDLLDRFVNFTKTGLQKQCAEVKWEDLAKKDDGVIYAWSAQKCQGGWPDQGEVARVIKGAMGLYVLHYANKKVPTPQEKRAAWFSLLNKATVKKPA